MAYESNLRLFLQSVRAALSDELKIVIIGISVSPAREDIPFVSAVRRFLYKPWLLILARRVKFVEMSLVTAITVKLFSHRI